MMEVKMQTIVLKKVNGWWIADDSNMFKAVATANEKAGDVWEKVKKDFPNAKIGIESVVFGPATQFSFGPIVWMK